MATVVSITNPITGAVEQVDKLDHTAQQIDDAAAMALQLSNPNLLDNWYFGNPVNQRNVSGTIDTVGYFLDRWKLVSGSATVGSNGITLNGTIVQILETAVSTDVTASALTTEGIVNASYDSSSKTFSLNGTGQTFVAAKLELGTQQTLAHQDDNGVWVLNEIPDYGEQLRRCQRYSVHGVGQRCSGYAINGSDRATIFIPTPVTMRTIASAEIVTADNLVTSYGDIIPIKSFSPAVTLPNGVVGNLQINSPVTQNCVVVASGFKCNLIADL